MSDSERFTAAYGSSTLDRGFGFVSVDGMEPKRAFVHVCDVRSNGHRISPLVLGTRLEFRLEQGDKSRMGPRRRSALRAG